MHGQICPPFKQGFLYFLDEQPLAADLGQRHVKDDVSTGFQDEQLDIQPGMPLLQQSLDMIGLPQGQRAAPGCYDKFFHAFSTGCRKTSPSLLRRQCFKVFS